MLYQPRSGQATGPSAVHPMGAPGRAPGGDSGGSRTDCPAPVPLLRAHCWRGLQRGPGQPLAASSVPTARVLGRASLGPSRATWLVRGRTPPGLREALGTRWSPAQQHGADVGERRARRGARLHTHLRPARSLLRPQLSRAEGMAGPGGSAGLGTSQWGSPGMNSLRGGSACSFLHQLLGKTVGNGDATGQGAEIGSGAEGRVCPAQAGTGAGCGQLGVLGGRMRAAGGLRGQEEGSWGSWGAGGGQLGVSGKRTRAAGGLGGRDAGSWGS